MRPRSGLTSDPALLAMTYANLGAAYRALGEDEKAYQTFEQSLRFNPNQFNAWLGLGLLAQKQGKLDEAISDLSRSVEVQPTAQALFRTRPHSSADRAYPRGAGCLPAGAEDLS